MREPAIESELKYATSNWLSWSDELTSQLSRHHYDMDPLGENQLPHIFELAEL